VHAPGIRAHLARVGPGSGRVAGGGSRRVPGRRQRVRYPGPPGVHRRPGRQRRLDERDRAQLFGIQRGARGRPRGGGSVDRRTGRGRVLLAERGELPCRDRGAPGDAAPALRRGPRRGSAWAGLSEAVAFIRSDRRIWTVVVLMAVFSIFGFPYLVMMPVFARDVLHRGATGYGVMMTAVGIGALIGALAVAALDRRIRKGPTLIAAGAAV